MARKDDITRLIQYVADRGTNEDRLSLGTPGSTVRIDDQDYDTGQLWTTKPSFVVMMVEGLGLYFDEYMKEVEQKIEDAF
jgi:hypothetical protein